MKYIFRLSLIAAILALMTCGAMAQSNSIVVTTLGAAVASTDRTVTVASATGISVSPQTQLLIDTEVMAVTSVSSTTIGVTRQNPAPAHASGTIVRAGRPNWFYAVDPPMGTCSITPLYVYPWVNIVNASVWRCVDSAWQVNYNSARVPSRDKVSNIPLGSVAYSSLGTSTATVDGRIYTTEIFVPETKSLTGLAVLFGTATSTDAYVATLYDDSGAIVATSLLTGTAYAGSANTFHTFAFTATYVAVGPRRYYASIQANGGNSQIRLVAASTYVDIYSQRASGTFGTVPALTVPTGFTALYAPIVYLY